MVLLCNLELLSCIRNTVFLKVVKYVIRVCFWPQHQLGVPDGSNPGHLLGEHDKLYATQFAF